MKYEIDDGLETPDDTDIWYIEQKLIYYFPEDYMTNLKSFHHVLKIGHLIFNGLVVTRKKEEQHRETRDIKF